MEVTRLLLACGRKFEALKAEDRVRLAPFAISPVFYHNILTLPVRSQTQ
jgi:hypothetical protein